MAFMMPVMKKNYNIYGDRQQRRPSIEGTDGHGRKISQASATGRRVVRSEGPSLSTSPAARGLPENMNPGGIRVIKNSSKPILMRRGRGSAPLLAVNSVPFHRNNSLPGGPSTAPTGNSPAPVSPTHSTGSSSSSETSGTPHHRFHIRLLSRLRKSFRMKDPAPAAS